MELKDGTLLFGSSKFVGYKDNTIEKAKALKSIGDGRVTNNAIDKVVKEYTSGNVKGYIEDAKYDELLKQSFFDFKFRKNKRHFWIVNHNTNDIKSIKKLKLIQGNLKKAEFSRTIKVVSKDCSRHHTTLE